MNKLEKAAHIIVHTCLKIKKSEAVLVVTDEQLYDIGHLLWHTASKVTTNAALLEIKWSRKKDAEPPSTVCGAMLLADVLLLATSRSLSHTQARRKACRRGARVVTMPDITADTMRRAVDIDYRENARRSRILADILTIGQEAHLTTPAGTNAYFPIAGKKGYADTGLVHEPGSFSNLPAGESCVGPSEGKSHGRVVIERGMANFATRDDSIIFDVKDGHVQRIKGGDGAEQLRRLLSKFGPKARNIAELGIGTNPKARIVGCTLEDEKTRGTAHVAVGNSISFGGKVDVPVHLDGILLQPTLTVDSKVIIDNGQLIV